MNTVNTQWVTGGQLNRMAAVVATHSNNVFYYTDDVQPLDAPDIMPAGSSVLVQSADKDWVAGTICARGF